MANNEIIIKNIIYIFTSVVIIFGILIVFNSFRGLFTDKKGNTQLLQTVTIEGLKKHHKKKSSKPVCYQSEKDQLDDEKQQLNDEKQNFDSKKEELGIEVKKMAIERQRIKAELERIALEKKLDIIYHLELEKLVSEKFIKDDMADDFCKNFQGSSNTLDAACSQLTDENCNKTNCCVLLNGKKCVAGNQSGPTFQTAPSGKDTMVDYYYYQNKKCREGDCR